MSTYRLDRLFAPRSIAVVGASPRDTSPGRAVLKNLRSGGFAGAIHLVNPHYDSIEGIAAVKSYEALATTPDVAVIAVPPAAVAPAVRAAAAKGTAAAIILTAGLGHGAGSIAEHASKRRAPPACGSSAPIASACWRRARISMPASPLRMPQPGDLCVISQSGAIATGLVEWAALRGIGFSAIVSIGDSLDVDFADLLDHFAVDRGTRAILLYIELVKDARKFMSAARAAARAKPVLVVKSGRHAAGAKAAMTHTGALAGSDAVYDAAFRRAGFIRALDLDELFAAAENARPCHLGCQLLAGNRLAILTNGGGIGVLAVDRLADLGGYARRDFARDDEEARCGAAADLVARQSGRYRRRCGRGALCRCARTFARRRRQRRRAGHERSDRACFRRRCRARRGRRDRAAPSDERCAKAGIRGLGRWRRARVAKSSIAPAFPITRPKPRPSPASCIWCNIANRAGS